jgi:hypothetical protein
MATEALPGAEALLARVASTPDILVQKFDGLRNAALLVAIDRKTYRAASFLDDRILTAGVQGAWVSHARLAAASGTITNLRPLHFIFHAGHVGSTLISRLLDEAGGVLSLREPILLRQIAEAYDNAGKADSLLSQASFQGLLDLHLRLWGRGYTDTTSVVLKATSSCGRLATAILHRLIPARAIYLNVRAEPYVATLLTGQNPMDLRGHAPERMRRLVSYGVGDSPPLHALSVGEVAALSWLVESWSECAALDAGGGRVAAVDFDAFLTNVEDGIGRVVQHLGLPYDPQFAQRAARSPLMTQYAKAPEHAYSPDLRAQVLAQSRSQNAVEIRKGLVWLERIASGHAGAAAVVSRVNGLG